MMSAWQHSVRLKMTLAYSAALAAILLIFAVATFMFTRGQLIGQLSVELHADLSAIQELLEHDPGELGELEEHGVVALFRVERDNHVLYETSGWRRLQLVVAATADVERSALGADEHYYRLTNKSSSTGGVSTRLLVARSEESVRRAIRSLAWVIGLGFPLTLVLAVAGGYVLAGRMLSPVGAMARKAHEITAEKLSDRLPVKSPHDEFGQLATAFNTMLARMEDSFDRLRRFTADASHELRTPLTALRSVGEVALRDQRDATAYRETIESMLEDTDRLTRLVDSLLTLARADSGRIDVVREPVDLSALAQEVMDFLRALADERSQQLSIETPGAVEVEADRGMIRQAVVNLIDNAIKYTPSSGQIRVTVRRSATGEAFIEVGDSGPGIPSEERERIFERFYRIDKARSREHGGVGLGLAIARWSVESQAGRIEVESVPGKGSTFRIVFPAKR